MGIVWFILGLTGAMGWIARLTPRPVIRGIQISLGVLLAMEAVKLIWPAWGLGLPAIAVILVLRDNRYTPAAVVLIVMGLVMMGFRGDLSAVQAPAFRLPPLTDFSLQELWQSLLLAGFAQIPLTATNAIIATSALIGKYWPDKRVSENRLAFNHGVMNLVLPLFGGMPMCHGAGGLAGQYYFGARTGGTNIIEGALELFLGLFLAGSIASLFVAFPSAIIGGMMLLVGVELTKLARDIRLSLDLISLAVTVAVAVLTNMAFGFAAGTAAYYLVRRICFRWRRRSD